MSENALSRTCRGPRGVGAARTDDIRHADSRDVSSALAPVRGPLTPNIGPLGRPARVSVRTVGSASATLSARSRRFAPALASVVRRSNIDRRLHRAGLNAPST